MASGQEEEVLGKAYDSRLMKRLLRYLRPYRWQVTVALVSIVLKAVADVLGPFLTMVAIDRYLAPTHSKPAWLTGWLSPRPLTGIAEIAGIYVGLTIFSFLLEYLQTYFMQWAGQMVMYDLRSEIFRHLQRMHIGFYDKNPVGRLVTRVTTDVDALNEMFTSGGDPRHHAVGELEAGADHVCSASVYRVCHENISRPGAGFVPADSSGDRAYQCTSSGARERHGGAAIVQPREESFQEIF